MARAIDNIQPAPGSFFWATGPLQPTALLPRGKAQVHSLCVSLESVLVPYEEVSTVGAPTRRREPV